MASQADGILSEPDREKQINLTALRKIDEYIVEIIDNASQVYLYKYCIESNEWVDCGVEGSFFLYKRSCTPYHGFLIMNRMNTTNQVEPFISGLDFLLREPCLLYKNNSSNIFCVWFYEVQHFLRITNHIQQIVKAMKGKGRLQRQRSESESALPKNNHCPVPNILTILSHAQMEYEKNNSQEKNSVSKETKPKLINDCVASSSNSKLLSLLKNSPSQSSVEAHSATGRQRLLSFNEDHHNFLQDEPTSNDLSGTTASKIDDSVPNSFVHDGTEESTDSLEESNNFRILTPEMFQATMPLASFKTSVVVPEISGEHLSFSDGEPSTDKCVSGHSMKLETCQTKVDGQHSTLYKSHLSQALIHLLSTEPNMLAKIHRAYISSLNSHIKTLSSS